MPDKHVNEEETRQGKPADKKSSNQVEERSDDSGKMSEKPAINILKKTFTSMLSKVQLGRSHVDYSSEDDDCSAGNRPELEGREGVMKDTRMWGY